jgi:hypothetical protein
MVAPKIFVNDVLSANYQIKACQIKACVLFLPEKVPKKILDGKHLQSQEVFLS